MSEYVRVGDYDKDLSMPKSMTGNEYQIKILCLLLLRSLKKKLHFKLITELKVKIELSAKVSQFNDCILSYTLDEEIVAICVEAKHRKTGSQNITASNLLNIQGTDSKLNKDFNLQRYFDSYKKLKDDDNIRNATSKYFVLYTPLGLDFEENETVDVACLRQMKPAKCKGKDIILNFEKVTERHLSLNSLLGKESACYRLKYTPDIVLKDATQNEVEEFLENFYFYINQRSEREFDELLPREVSALYNENVSKEGLDELLNRLRAWTMSPTPYFFTREMAESIFNQVLSSQSRNYLKQESERFLNVINDYEIEFTELWDDIDNFLCSEEAGVLNIVSSADPLFAFIKLQHTLRESNHCVSELSILTTENRKEEELLSAISSNKPYIVLILCAKEELRKEEVELLGRLYQCVEELNTSENCSTMDVMNGSDESCNIKLIVVSHTDHKIPLKETKRKISAGCYTEKLVEEEINMSCLTRKCQQKLLKKEVDFQGVCVPLENLIDDNCLSIINEDILRTLVTGTKKVRIGKALELQKSNECFIPRRLLRQDMVSHECLGSKLDGIFAISGEYTVFEKLLENKSVSFREIDRNCNFSGGEVIVLDEDPKQQFKRLCEIHRYHVIHWVHAIGNNLYWQVSYKSATSIQKYIDANEWTKYHAEGATCIPLIPSRAHKTYPFKFLRSSDGSVDKEFIYSNGTGNDNPRSDCLEDNLVSLVMAKPLDTENYLLPVAMAKPIDTERPLVPLVIEMPLHTQVSCGGLTPRNMVQTNCYEAPLGIVCTSRSFVKSEETTNSMPIDTPVIIAAEPGMGKTTLLKYIHEQEKRTDLSSLVILLNCTDFVKKENYNFENFVECLCDIQCLDTKFSKDLFKYFCTSKQVTLLIDRLDEIKEDYREKMSTLFQQLISFPGVTLWITTRPHLKMYLEDLLCTASFKLDAFNEEERFECLKRTWINQFGSDGNDRKIDRIPAFSDMLIRSFSNERNNDVLDLLKTPLHVSLFAEIYADACRRYCEEDNSDSLRDTCFDLFELHERFIEKKYSLFVEEKAGINRVSYTHEPTVERYKQADIVLGHKALLVLYPDERSLLSVSKCNSESVRLNEDTLCNIGMIQKDGDRTEFFHRSFAEFYVAVFLSVILKGENAQERKIVSEFLKKIMFNRNFYPIRRFLDYKLWKDSQYKHVLYNGIECTHFPEENVDCLQRTVVHLAAYLKRNRNLEILLNKFPCSVDKEDIFGKTPMDYAVESENWEGAIILLHNGAGLRLEMEGKLRVFCEACRSEYPDIVGSILSSESDSAKGKFLLSRGIAMAVENGHAKIIQKLVEETLNLKELLRPREVLALNFLPSNLERVKNLNLMSMLLLPNFEGPTVIHLAARYGHTEMLEFITNSLRDNPPCPFYLILLKRDNEGNTPLHLACEFNQLDAIKFLLQVMEQEFHTSYYVESLCEENSKQKSALDYILQSHDENIVNLCLEAILEHGRDLPVLEQNTPIVHAYSGCLKFGIVNVFKIVVTFLSKNGIDVNDFMLKFNSSLYKAAEKGYVEIITAVLDFVKGGGGNTSTIISKRDLSSGRTLLHFAAIAHKVSVVELLPKYLEERGGNLDIVIQKDKDGQTALSYAIDYRYDVILELLLKYISNYSYERFALDIAVPKVFHRVAGTGNRSLMELLCEVDVLGRNYKEFLFDHDEGGRSPVIYASTAGRVEMVQFILQYIERYGGDPYTVIVQKDVCNRTALHSAAMSGNLAVLKLLISVIEEKCESALPLLKQFDGTGFRPVDIPFDRNNELYTFLQEYMEAHG